MCLFCFVLFCVCSDCRPCCDTRNPYVLIFASFASIPIPLCLFSFRFVSTWIVLSWCEIVRVVLVVFVVLVMSIVPIVFVVLVMLVVPLVPIVLFALAVFVLLVVPLVPMVIVGRRLHPA